MLINQTTPSDGKETSESFPIRLEFMRHFKHNVNHMSRHDLEELVMQKFTEAIVCKSEISSLRQKLEKQENQLTMCRKQAANLTAQLHKLENLSSMILADPNCKSVLPTKITRGVCIQSDLRLLPHEKHNNNNNAEVIQQVVSLTSHATATNQQGGTMNHFTQNQFNVNNSIYVLSD